ncbi:MbcA/ParS/Xre antitoxin family protein [Vibrio crassostreae]|uniref:MbcA/ParS/Xre antitoxin family protein n=1 Tax=Vibrio crassostreae TaxID=246167 RepID=UPI0021A72687|nr:MbcA/ParS/Xre antitoxin family protein [Vibrio crassostreae]
MFNNPSNVYGFMTMKNHNPFFDGKTPLSFIASGELAALEQVAEHLTALSIGN